MPADAKTREQLLRELEDVREQLAELQRADSLHQEIEEALRVGEERYRSFYNNTPVMMHSIDDQGRLINVNDYWLGLLGYERSEVLGRRSTDFLTETSRRTALEVHLPEFWKTGVAREVEYQMVKKNGEVIDVLLTAVAEFDEQGKIDHTLAFIVDITERKRAELALRASEGRLRKFFEHSNDAGFVLDPAHDTVVDVNSRASELLGYTRDEFLALPVSAIHPDEMPRLRAFTQSVLKVGSGWTDELTCLTKSKEKVDAEISASAVEIDGQPRVVAWVRDITQRKRAEAALRESEERFRLLVERAADAIYVVERDGRLADVNQQACEQTGYTRDELYRMRVWNVAEGLTPDRFRRNVEQMREIGPLTLGDYHRRKDGKLFPVEVRAALFEARGTQRVLALARDVSERVRAEEERRKLNLEKVYLQEELEMEHNFGEIVGSSPMLRKLFRDVERVARTDSTVLITGETGTGKELIARAIHGASSRKDRVLVKVNCAALSSGLIESELFGHEKGAFTGAVSRRVGRFELADDGSILLDEVGDLPAELQAKLLRVLQEGEFERVGGTKTMKVDVRVIAATNRDLEEAVEEGRFRVDLYYRLKVFPLHVPPLRERRQDIPQLVNYFARKYGTKLGRKIESVPQQTLNSLVDYSWPGNVRELENVIERAVIISAGSELDLGDWREEPAAAAAHGRPATLDESQRQHIVAVLEQTGWRVSGPKGAARILGLKPTTLAARMKKLGIERSH